jgi:hypothetical protein
MPSLLDVLGYAGNALDLPGSSVRDLLTGNNPFDQWLTPFSSDNRATGRDVLNPIFGANEETGMAGWLDNPMEGVKDVAGFGAEMLLDPTNLIPGRAILKALKGRKAAKATNKLIDAENLANAGRYGRVNAKVLMDDMLPEQAVDDVVNPITGEAPQRLLGYTPGGEDPMFPGVELMSHGGHDMSASATKTHPYGIFDLGRLKTGEGANMYGPGAYKADLDSTSGNYVKLVQDKLDDQFYRTESALAKYFEPGRILSSPQGYHTDKVLEFKPADADGNWAVKVQSLVKEDNGGYRANGRPRWHATMPDANQFKRVLGENPNKARLYKYDAPIGTKDRFLNWDAPVSAQPPAVQAMTSNEYPGMTPDLWDELNSLVEMRDQQYKLSRDQLEVWGSDNPMDKFRFDTMTQQLAELDQLITAKHSELYTKNVPDTLIWSDDPAGAMKTGEDIADELMGGSPSEATLADTAGLREAGVPGVKNLARSTGRTSYNYAIWDQDLLNQMRVRMIDGQRVPINPTTLVQQQLVPARRGIADENLLDLTNPMREKREVPNALKPVVAGAVFNLLARQNNYGGAL